MSTTRALDQLQQVQELNRVFLELLQERVRGQRGSLGLPPGVGQAIAIATGPLLDGVAGFPRALFYVDVGSQLRPACTDADFDEAEHDVCLSILFAARHTQPPKHVSGTVAVRSRSGRRGAAALGAATRPAAARVHTGCAQVRVPRAPLVLARAVHRDAPGAAPPTHSDGAPARHRARLAAAPAAATDRLKPQRRLSRRGSRPLQ